MSGAAPPADFSRKNAGGNVAALEQVDFVCLADDEVPLSALIK